MTIAAAKRKYAPYKLRKPGLRTRIGSIFLEHINSACISTVHQVRLLYDPQTLVAEKPEIKIRFTAVVQDTAYALNHFDFIRTSPFHP